MNNSLSVKMSILMLVGITVTLMPPTPDSATVRSLAASEADDDDKKTQDDAPENNSRFHKQLLKIAGEYRKYGRANANAHLALLDCRAPSAHLGLPRISQSDDGSTHGRKLYYLYAKRKAEYLAAKKNREQKGQVIVKEAWIAEPAGTDRPLIERKTNKSGKVTRRFEFTAEKDGKRYVQGKPASLFIMFRSTSKDGTDNGWVYGTVSPDKKKVTSAGRVESCMNCHKDAPHGRLFGLKQVWK